MTPEVPIYSINFVVSGDFLYKVQVGRKSHKRKLLHCTASVSGVKMLSIRAENETIRLRQVLPLVLSTTSRVYDCIKRVLRICYVILPCIIFFPLATCGYLSIYRLKTAKTIRDSWRNSFISLRQLHTVVIISLATDS